MGSHKAFFGDFTIQKTDIGYENDMSLPVSDDHGWVESHAWMSFATSNTVGCCAEWSAIAAVNCKAFQGLAGDTQTASQPELLELLLGVGDVLVFLGAQPIENMLYVRVGILRIPDILDGSPHPIYHHFWPCLHILSIQPLKREKKVGTSSTCEVGPLPILAAAWLVRTQRGFMHHYLRWCQIHGIPVQNKMNIYNYIIILTFCNHSGIGSNRICRDMSVESEQAARVFSCWAEAKHCGSIFSRGGAGGLPVKTSISWFGAS